MTKGKVNIKEQKKSDPASKGMCFHCNEPGHWKRNCKKFLAKKKLGEASTSNQGLFMIEINFLESQNSTWVLDTGCGSHICNNVKGLVRSRKLNKDEVILRVGNRAKVTELAVGTYCLAMPSGKSIFLNNCYYVPNIIKNIISISVLDIEGFDVIIKNNGCSIYKDDVLYGIGNL